MPLNHNHKDLWKEDSPRTSQGCFEAGTPDRGNSTIVPGSTSPWEMASSGVFSVAATAFLARSSSSAALSIPCCETADGDMISIVAAADSYVVRSLPERTRAGRLESLVTELMNAGVVWLASRSLTTPNSCVCSTCVELIHTHAHIYIYSLDERSSPASCCNRRASTENRMA